MPRLDLTREHPHELAWLGRILGGHQAFGVVGETVDGYFRIFVDHVRTHAAAELREG